MLCTFLFKCSDQCTEKQTRGVTRPFFLLQNEFDISDVNRSDLITFSYVRFNLKKKKKRSNKVILFLMDCHFGEKFAEES